MKVSLQWAQSVSNVDLLGIPKQELIQKIGAQLGAIEEVIDWGARYDGILVVKVVSCEQHPNADKLHVCLIDDGGVAKNVDRNEQDLVQVVCGAPNVAAGMTVAWLPPGSTVPSSLDKDPFVLSARELRGVVSNGMLASASELGISEDHDGILEIIASDVGEENTVPGTPFKNLYGLNDTIIDCENKMFTHRPDCFGILGVARELAGISGQAFVSPSWYLATPQFKEEHDLPLKVSVETSLVPRFMAVAVDTVTVGPSSVKMQSELTRVGIRPINNVVDITNWLMHLTGQPLHAYDYDKLAERSSETPTLVARPAKKDEQIVLLNGKSLTLDEVTMVIATDKEAVGVAGVMGGADTEVDASTKRIVIEVGSFDMYAIRKSSMKYGLFTDAVTRFNKGQSPLQNDRIMAKALEMVHDIAGGTQASSVFDIATSDAKNSMPSIATNIDFINTRLGSSLTVADCAKLLQNVECVENLSKTQETRSYLVGVGDITEKLERIGVKIVEKTEAGHYKLVIPAESIEDYEKLISWEIKPGVWNEYIGAKNVFLFKDLDTKVSRYEVSDDTEHEIVEMCRTFANDYYTSIDSMLSANAWYKPLLPLKKTFIAEQKDANAITIQPPFWRRDLELAEDIVEEIGRLYGFDQLPVALPKRTASPVVKNSHLELLRHIRSIMFSAGANELLTYSFVHENLLSKAGQSSADAFHIRNALSPDLQYYRLSITPSLLEKVNMNIRAGYKSFALYEMGRTHNKLKEVLKNEVPEEYNMLAYVVTSSEATAKGSAYYQAKHALDFLAKQLGVTFDYEPLDSLPEYPVLQPFEVSRSAYVYVSGTKTILGIVGEYKQSVYDSFKLPQYTAGFEIGTSELLDCVAVQTGAYKAVSKFPSSQQDITLEYDNHIAYSSARSCIVAALVEAANEHGYEYICEPGDIYAPESSDKKRVSFKITLSHPHRTLTTKEVSKAIDDVSRSASSVLGAARI